MVGAGSRNVGTGGELGSGGRGSGRSGTETGIGAGAWQILALVLAEACRTPRRSTKCAARWKLPRSGSELGDLFEYKLKDRVTIRKNESALVPIVQAHVEAEKVSLWNAGLDSPRPLRALWLTNSSPLTLDGGSFSILESEAFAGEGLTDSIKPGEKRLLSYAADLGVARRPKAEEQSAARHARAHRPRRDVSNQRAARGNHVHRSRRRYYAARRC